MLNVAVLWRCYSYKIRTQRCEVGRQCLAKASGDTRIVLHAQSVRDVAGELKLNRRPCSAIGCDLRRPLQTNGPSITIRHDEGGFVVAEPSNGSNPGTASRPISCGVGSGTLPNPGSLSSIVCSGGHTHSSATASLAAPLSSSVLIGKLHRWLLSPRPLLPISMRQKLTPNEISVKCGKESADFD